jgi:hypothetical protein
VNRTELQQLAVDRLHDAKALLDAGRWSGAYYLAGYAVECALKSCILHYVQRTGIIFEDRKYAQQCWTHNVADLVTLADLKVPLDIAKRDNPGLKSNWTIVETWSEESRYRQVAEETAALLYNAINHPEDGVLSWIKSHW